MNFGFSYIGFIFMAMLIIPNIIYTKNQPTDYEKYAAEENKVLQIFERIGEVLVTCCALIFLDFNIVEISPWSLWLLGAFALMILYEIYWVRYFKSEKTTADFYRNLLGIPLAGASLPVAAFLLLGVYGRNIFMIISAVILGIGHIGIHWQHRKEIGDD